SSRAGLEESGVVSELLRRRGRRRGRRIRGLARVRRRRRVGGLVRVGRLRRVVGLLRRVVVLLGLLGALLLGLLLGGLLADLVDERLELVLRDLAVLVRVDLVEVLLELSARLVLAALARLLAARRGRGRRVRVRRRRVAVLLRRIRRRVLRRLLLGVGLRGRELLLGDLAVAVLVEELQEALPL